MLERPAVVVHGGAGTAQADLADEKREGCAAAAAAAFRALEAGGTALDAVTEAVAMLEDLPAFNAGRGSCLNADGRVEMDASVMDGASLAAGATALVRRVANPVRLARAILGDGRHVFVAGDGAEGLARAAGLRLVDPDELVTERQRQVWASSRGAEAGTVGAVAVDLRGHVAAATSTGGIRGKLAGRIGDSAVIGAGTYADDEAGAASATGRGEPILRLGVARLAVDLLRSGLAPATAVREVLRRARERAGADLGLIVVDRFGRAAWGHSTASMSFAAIARCAGGTLRDGAG